MKQELKEFGVILTMVALTLLSIPPIFYYGKVYILWWFP